MTCSFLVSCYFRVSRPFRISRLYFCARLKNCVCTKIHTAREFVRYVYTPGETKIRAQPTRKVKKTMGFTQLEHKTAQENRISIEEVVYIFQFQKRQRYH